MKYQMDKRTVQACHQLLGWFICLFLLTACQTPPSRIDSNQPQDSPQARNAWLGVQFKHLELSPHKFGLQIQQVIPKSAAHQAGLLAGDVITEYDQQTVSKQAQTATQAFLQHLRQKQVGEPLDLAIMRMQQQFTGTWQGKPVEALDAQSLVKLLSRPQGFTETDIRWQQQRQAQSIRVILQARPAPKQRVLVNSLPIYPLAGQRQALQLQHIFKTQGLQAAYTDLQQRYQADEQWAVQPLSTVSYLHQHPLQLPGFAARLLPQLAQAELPDLLAHAARLLDQSLRLPAQHWPTSPHPAAHLEFIQAVLTRCCILSTTSICWLAG